MRKNNLIKSRKSNGAIAKVVPKRKSTPSKGHAPAKKTLANGFAGPTKSEKNSAWKDRLKKFPDMGERLQEAIDRYQAGKLEDAVRLLEKLIVDFPDQAPILWYLGGMYLDLGKPDLAIPHFRRATELSPKSERASLGLFHALWDTDRLDEALEEMKRFQVLTDWSCSDYIEILAEVNEKWADPVPDNNKKKKTGTKK